MAVPLFGAPNNKYLRRLLFRPAADFFTSDCPTAIAKMSAMPVTSGLAISSVATFPGTLS
jgi:hypothetical protein